MSEHHKRTAVVCNLDQLPTGVVFSKCRQTTEKVSRGDQNFHESFTQGLTIPPRLWHDFHFYNYLKIVSSQLCLLPFWRFILL